MTPNFHSNGTSFSGCAKYLLHDVDASTSGRVEWTETVNLSTNNPQAAWRVMAAISMRQNQLKKDAGLRPGGRTSKDHVGHVSISWNPEEGQSVSKEEKLRTAKWLLKEIGADDRQALIVSHQDTKHQHIHIMWNRVSTENGKILVTSHNKRKASRLAQKYEEDRMKAGITDKIYCPQRVINNKLRDQGIRVKYDGALSRDQYEKSKSQQEHKLNQKRIDQQRARMAKLKQDKRDLASRHRRKQHELAKEIKTKRDNLVSQKKSIVQNAKRQAADKYAQKWKEVTHNHQVKLEAFKRQENDMRGRLANAFSLIDFGAVFGGKKPAKDGRVSTLSGIFGLNDEGKRLETIKRQHKLKEEKLNTEQRKAEAASMRKARNEYKSKVASLATDAKHKQDDLLRGQRLEISKSQAKIAREGKKQRIDLGLNVRLKKTKSPDALSRPQNQQGGKDIKQNNAATGGKMVDQSPANDNKNNKTNPSDLVPKKGAREAAKQMDQAKPLIERLRANKRKAKQEKERGDDDGGRSR